MMSNSFKLLVSFILFINFQVKAQSPTWTWAKQGGANTSFSSVQEGANAIATDFSGNSYITGGFTDSAVFGGNQIFSYGHYDIFITKYDSSGNNIWARKAGGYSNFIEHGNDIVLDNFGNIYLAGRFRDTAFFGGDTLIDLGNEMMFVAKYDTSGNAIWARKPGEARYGNVEGIGVDMFGNYYIAGSFKDTAFFGTDTLLSSGDHDVFLAKFDSIGNVVWAKHAGGSMNDQCIGFSMDINNNIYITGQFQSPADFGGLTITSSGWVNIFTAKYDSDGNVIWAQGAGGALYFNYGRAVSHDSIGNCYVTGMFGDTAAFGSFTLVAAFNKTEIFVAKYDTAGNIKWAKRAGGEMDDQASGIITDAIGNSYIAGGIYDTATFDNFTLVNSGGAAVVAMYDSSGAVIWTQQAHGKSGGSDISLDGLGNMYFIGGLIDTVSFGPHDLLCSACSDLFIAKLNGSEFTGLDGIINENVLTLVYPNPVNDKLNISVNTNELSEIIIYDIASRKILEQQFTNTITLNLEMLAKGMYVYEIRNKWNVIKQGKFVKE